MTDGPQCKYQDFIFRSLLIGKVGKSPFTNLTNLDCNQKDRLIFPLLQNAAVNISIAHEGNVLTTCPVTHLVGLLQISSDRDDWRIFWGLKISILGFFGGRKNFGKYFFGGSLI